MSVSTSGATKRLVFLFLAAWTLTGCRRDEIQTYRVAKETAPTMPAMPGMAAAGDRKEITWKTPAGWQEQAPSTMRVGSFLIKDGAETADVSVIPLAGDVGGLLANLNRWRGQIGLNPLAENELTNNISPRRFGGQAMTWTDFAHNGQRITAAIYEHDGRSWFFKMTGPDALVQKSQAAFKEFLASVRLTHTHE